MQELSIAGFSGSAWLQEEQYELRPGKNDMRWLRMIAREIANGTVAGSPHLQLVDTFGDGAAGSETADLLHDYPELRCYRDAAFLWKWYACKNAPTHACMHARAYTCTHSVLESSGT